ncbi:MAG TPA: hypothetical protein VEZ90_08115, partial [Blastocatellia bacterium]|nr:hypothetical protein [Blastocatellia bacterium]
MGFFTGSTSWQAPPGLQQLQNAFQAWNGGASDPGLGVAGKIGKQMLKALSGGVDNPYVNQLLTPLEESYQTNARNISENAGAGANAMVSGQQAGLTQALQDEALRQNSTSEGEAMAQAIPG